MYRVCRTVDPCSRGLHFGDLCSAFLLPCFSFCIRDYGKSNLERAFVRVFIETCSLLTDSFEFVFLMFVFLGRLRVAEFGAEILWGCSFKCVDY